MGTTPVLPTRESLFTTITGHAQKAPVKSLCNRVEIDRPKLTVSPPPPPSSRAASDPTPAPPLYAFHPTHTAPRCQSRQSPSMASCLVETIPSPTATRKTRSCTPVTHPKRGRQRYVPHEAHSSFSCGTFHYVSHLTSCTVRAGHVARAHPVRSARGHRAVAGSLCFAQGAPGEPAF